jgi:hypothetical protein
LEIEYVETTVMGLRIVWEGGAVIRNTLKAGRNDEERVGRLRESRGILPPADWGSDTFPNPMVPYDRGEPRFAILEFRGRH